MKKPLQLTKELFFPPRCAACGNLLAPVITAKTPALCVSCRKKFEEECRHQCPRCFLSYRDCHCVLPNMVKRGFAAHIKLAPYGDSESSVVRHVVLTIKESRDRRIFRFLVEELAPSVRAAITAAERARARAGESPLETVIAYLPRTRYQKRRTGTDQAAELASALAKELALPMLPLFRRAGNSYPQKSLSRRKREANIAGAFAASAQGLAGKRLLLVDDVVTTGVGMCEAARLVKVDELMAVSVAFTEKNHQK